MNHSATTDFDTGLEAPSATPAYLCPVVDPQLRSGGRSGPGDRREGAGRPGVVPARIESRGMAVSHSTQRGHLGPTPYALDGVARRFRRRQVVVSAASGERTGRERVPGGLSPPVGRRAQDSPARGREGTVPQADRRALRRVGRHGEKPDLSRPGGARADARRQARRRRPLSPECAGDPTPSCPSLLFASPPCERDPNKDRTRARRRRCFT